MLVSAIPHESVIGMHTSHPSWSSLPSHPPPPSRSPQSTGFELPVYSNFPLAVYFTCGNGTDYVFLDSKINADGDCSHKIERRLLLGRKAITNLDSMLKSTDTTLPTKVHIVNIMVFPSSSHHVWMWELDHKESWPQRKLMLLNCGVGEDYWESLGLQGDPTSPS